jgi:hypothetical protein
MMGVQGPTKREIQVEKRYYSIESLELALRGFEERFGMSSDRFFEIYQSDEVPAEIPGFEGFVWADTYQELCRLRGRVESRSAQPA